MYVIVSVLPAIGFPVFGQRGGTWTSFVCFVSVEILGFLIVFNSMSILCKNAAKAGGGSDTIIP